MSADLPKEEHDDIEARECAAAAAFAQCADACVEPWHVPDSEPQIPQPQYDRPRERMRWTDLHEGLRIALTGLALAVAILVTGFVAGYGTEIVAYLNR